MTTDRIISHMIGYGPASLQISSLPLCIVVQAKVHSE
jgi:hypothetical protein